MPVGETAPHSASLHAGYGQAAACAELPHYFRKFILLGHDPLPLPL
jgi:hypothetical protein